MPTAPTMPDLDAFKVVPPNKDVRVEDLTLPDGSPMVGPDGLLIPPARNFSMIVNSATRVYSYRFDEAMRDNPNAARGMRRDAFILGLLEERILPTINREWSLEVDDDRDPEQQYVRDGLSRIVRSIKNFDAMKRALLDAVWFGRAGVGWTFAKQEEVDNLWGIGKFDPVHGDSVQFSFDGHPCIMMDAQTAAWYSSHGAKYGPPGVGDLVPTDRGGTALQLHRPYWRERYAIHQHILQKADYFEGEMAGSVQGFGLRGQVYWQYVVRTDALTWMLAYMQAVGQMDLLVFNYPAGNAAAKLQQEMNAQKIIGKAAIACPRDPKGTWPAVEQIPMNAAGLGALQKLVADYFDRHIERLIVGQSMSSGADKGTGLGGTGRADFARATKDEILVYDSKRLDQTLTYDLIAPLKKYNFPWAKFPVRFTSVLPDVKAQDKVMSGKVMISVGVPIKADELREAAGYSRPEPGDDVVGAPQSPPGGPQGGGGAPPGAGGPPGGGQPPPAWMGAPGGQPAMLARGQNPTRYLLGGMGYPGGSNTHVPKADKVEPIGTTRYAGISTLQMEPLERAIAKLSKQDLDGIRISVNDKMHQIHIDVMDWGDEKVAKPLIALAKKIVGDRNVEVVNEGPKPFGSGWKTLYERGGLLRYNLQDQRAFEEAVNANPPYRSGPFKKCSTQVNLVGESQFRVLQASSGIPDTDLADDGRETDAHVTIRYGLAEGTDPQDVAKLVGNFGPIKLRIGKASVFEKPEYDVLKFDVSSSDLRRLNALLKKLPGTDTFPDYKPHATVACLKKGLGKKYAAQLQPLNLDVTLDGIYFCDTSGVQTWISTTGKPAQPVWANNEDNASDVPRSGAPQQYARPRPVGLAQFVTPSKRKFQFGDCGLECAKIAQAALKAGYTNFRVIDGHVMVGDQLWPHSWLEDGGQIIDPTKSMFDGVEPHYAPDGEYFEGFDPQTYLDNLEDVYGDPSQYARPLDYAKKPKPVWHPEHMSQKSVVNPAHLTDAVRHLTAEAIGSSPEEDIAAWDAANPPESNPDNLVVDPNDLDGPLILEPPVPVRLPYPVPKLRPPDRSLLPILADALEEAGATDAPFLASLRDPNPARIPLWQHSVLHQIAHEQKWLQVRWDRHVKEYTAEKERNDLQKAVAPGLPFGYVVERDGGGPSGMRGNPPPGEIWYRDGYRSGVYWHPAQHKEGRKLTVDELRALLVEKKAREKAERTATTAANKAARQQAQTAKLSTPKFRQGPPEMDLSRLSRYSERSGPFPDSGRGTPLHPPLYPPQSEPFVTRPLESVPQNPLGPPGDQWRPGPTNPQSRAVEPGAPQDANGMSLYPSTGPDQAPVAIDKQQGRRPARYANNDEFLPFPKYELRRTGGPLGSPYLREFRPALEDGVWFWKFVIDHDNPDAIDVDPKLVRQAGELQGADLTPEELDAIPLPPAPEMDWRPDEMIPEDFYGYRRTSGGTPYHWIQAPPGGATLNGRPYRSGQFVPGTTMFTHTPRPQEAINPEAPLLYDPQFYGPPPMGTGGAQQQQDGTHALPMPANPGAPVQGAPQTSGGEPLSMPGAAAPQGPNDHPAPQTPGMAPGMPSGQQAPGIPQPVPQGPQPLRTPGLSPQDAVLEAQSQMFAWTNFGALRDAYFTQNAKLDPVSGDVRSLTLNSDAWNAMIPGFTGQNAGAVHQAAAWLNDQLFREALQNQAGKGNNKMLVVAGGMGDGTKGFADDSEYPLVLDQPARDYNTLADQFERARAAGMEPSYQYVDKPAAEHATESIEQALADRLAGRPAKAQPLEAMARTNLDARRTALEVLFRNPDVETAIVDHHGGERFSRRMITDKGQAAMYLARRLAEDERDVPAALEQTKQDLIRRQKAGEIPADLVTGFLGAGWNVRPPYPVRFDRNGQPTRYADETPGYADWLNDPDRVALSQSPIVGIRPTEKLLPEEEHGTHGSYFVDLANQRRGVFKPAHQERDVGRGVTPGSFHRREVAASVLADAMGMSHLVPKTAPKMHESPYWNPLHAAQGSIQDYIPDNLTPLSVSEAQRFGSPDDVAQAAAFDYVIGNQDRHSGNWFVDPDTGTPALIDNGLSLPRGYDPNDFVDNQSTSRFLQRAVRTGLQVPDLTDLFAKWPEIEKIFRGLGIEESAVELARQRLDQAGSTRDKPFGRLPAYWTGGKNGPPQSLGEEWWGGVEG